MDPLPYGPECVFLYGNSGQCFSGSAEKIAADVNFGVAAAFAPIYKAEGQHQKNIFLVCPSALIKAAWQCKASGLLLPCSGVYGAI